MNELKAFASNITKAGDTEVFDIGSIIDDASIIVTSTKGTPRISLKGSVDGENWYPIGTGSFGSSRRLSGSTHFQFVKATVGAIPTGGSVSLSLVVPGE